MVIMCVGNQDCGWMEAPHATQPVCAAIDQDSALPATDHDGGMHPMETRPRPNIPPSSEKRQAHDLTHRLWAPSLSSVKPGIVCSRNLDRRRLGDFSRSVGNFSTGSQMDATLELQSNRIRFSPASSIVPSRRIMMTTAACLARLLSGLA